MSMRSVFLGLMIMTSVQGQQATPELGKTPSKTMLKNWNTDVFPDGWGLPKGSGDADKGKLVYEKHCQSCHGVEGGGGSADELAGAGHGLQDHPPDKTIGTYWPYATTLFDFTRRSMPLNVPGSLSNDELYAITAYLLYLNGIIDRRDQMNAKTLPRVEMPNQAGFINVYQQQ